MSGRRRGGEGAPGPRAFTAALLRLFVRRIGDEWRATPIYNANLNRPRPTGLAARPRDFRPVDPEVGREILLGRMVLAGVTLEMGVGGDPWDVASPSLGFAVALHRFEWLPSLLAQGQAGADEALRLVLDWRRQFGRVKPFVWGADVVERRAFNLACAIHALAERASEQEAGALLLSMAGQGRHLMKLDGGPLRRAERATVAALVGAALSGRAGARLAAAALAKLSAALSEAVLPDGGLRSRNPEQGLELLFDLLTLDDALLQQGREAPGAMARSIDRLTGAVRFFTLGDGRLAAFQGGEAAGAKRVDAALAHDDGEAGVMTALPHAGYHRLAGRGLLVMVDAASPAEGAWSLAACAQPAALEITGGADRLIANTGWSAEVVGRDGLRLTDGGSTACLGDGSAGRPLSGLLARGLGSRLVSGVRLVEAHRQESDAGLWLELSHDGWVKSFGLTHSRRLFLDPHHDELRGEDRFEPVDAAAPAGRRAHAYAIRFHLHPDVQVSLARDKRSVLLRGPSNRGWWFRNDAPDVLLEPSIVFEDHVPRRGAQIVLKGSVVPGAGARVRWKLTPVDPADPRAAARSSSAPAPRPRLP